MTFAAVLIAVAIGGALGASLRFFLSRAFAPWSIVFPWGTLVANLMACFLLAAITFHAAAFARGWVGVLLTAGVAGGLSTYSTFAYETMAMAQEGDLAQAGLNVLLNVVGGAIAVGLAAVLL